MSRWRALPSLSMLRAFDATARAGSFAEAGRMLNVTQAAVAQAVRGLEAELGVPLVQRAGRTAAPTAAGAALARALDEGFGRLEQGVAALREAEAGRVVRTCTTTFIAEAHVMPRLPGFWALHPGIEVALTPRPDPRDPAREGFDLAICAMTEGRDEPGPVGEVRPLCRSPVVAVCAPSLLAGGRSAQDLPWLIRAGDPADLADLAAAGLDPDRLRRVELGSPHLEMAACRQGLGAAAATEIICHADLEAGRLVRLPLTGLPVVSYMLVLPHGPRRAAVETFAGWLQGVFLE